MQWQTYIRVVAIFFFSNWINFAFAQVNYSDTNETSPNIRAVFSESSLLSDRELYLAILVFIFAIFISLIAAYLLTKGQVAPDAVIRLISCIIIVSGLLFLIAAGYSGQQISPALGLLGTLAGYLLGRADTKIDETQGRTLKKQESQHKPDAQQKGENAEGNSNEDSQF